MSTGVDPRALDRAVARALRARRLLGRYGWALTPVQRELAAWVLVEEVAYLRAAGRGAVAHALAAPLEVAS